MNTLPSLVKNEEYFKIHETCKQYQIDNYSINKDLSIDVVGDVHLNFFYFQKLPLRFGKVTGNFECTECSLTTLEGIPREIGGYFMIIRNWLKRIDYFPDKIGGEIHMNGNSFNIREFITVFKKGFTPDQIHYKEDLDLTALYRIFVINSIANES